MRVSDVLYGRSPPLIRTLPPPSTTPLPAPGAIPWTARRRCATSCPASTTRTAASASSTSTSPRCALLRAPSPCLVSTRHVPRGTRPADHPWDSLLAARAQGNKSHAMYWTTGAALPPPPPLSLPVRDAPRPLPPFRVLDPRARAPWGASAASRARARVRSAPDTPPFGHTRRSRSTSCVAAPPISTARHHPRLPHTRRSTRS